MINRIENIDCTLGRISRMISAGETSKGNSLKKNAEIRN